MSLLLLASSGGDAAGQASQQRIWVDDVFGQIAYDGSVGPKNLDFGIDTTTGKALAVVKRRDSSDEVTFQDTVRGAGKHMATSNANIQQNVTQMVTAFTNVGYNVGTANNVGGNTTLARCIARLFKAAPRFFDVQEYTGDGNATKVVQHGLQSIPGMVIGKSQGMTSTTVDAVTGSGSYNVPANAVAVRLTGTGASGSITINPGRPFIAPQYVGTFGTTYLAGSTVPSGGGSVQNWVAQLDAPANFSFITFDNMPDSFAVTYTDTQGRQGTPGQQYTINLYKEQFFQDIGGYYSVRYSSGRGGWTGANGETEISTLFSVASSSVTLLPGQSYIAPYPEVNTGASSTATVLSNVQLFPGGIGVPATPVIKTFGIEAASATIPYNVASGGSLSIAYDVANAGGSGSWYARHAFASGELTLNNTAAPGSGFSRIVQMSENSVTVSADLNTSGVRYILFLHGHDTSVTGMIRTGIFTGGKQHISNDVTGTGTLTIPAGVTQVTLTGTGGDGVTTYHPGQSYIAPSGGDPGRPYIAPYNTTTLGAATTVLLNGTTYTFSGGDGTPANQSIQVATLPGTTTKTLSYNVASSGTLNVGYDTILVNTEIPTNQLVSFNLVGGGSHQIPVGVTSLTINAKGGDSVSTNVNRWIFTSGWAGEESNTLYPIHVSSQIGDGAPPATISATAGTGTVPFIMTMISPGHYTNSGTIVTDAGGGTTTRGGGIVAEAFYTQTPITVNGVADATSITVQGTTYTYAGGVGGDATPGTNTVTLNGTAQTLLYSVAVVGGDTTGVGTATISYLAPLVEGQGGNVGSFIKAVTGSGSITIPSGISSVKLTGRGGTGQTITVTPGQPATWGSPYTLDTGTPYQYNTDPVVSPPPYSASFPATYIFTGDQDSNTGLNIPITGTANAGALSYSGYVFDAGTVVGGGYQPREKAILHGQLTGFGTIQVLYSGTPIPAVDPVYNITTGASTTATVNGTTYTYVGGYGGVASSSSNVLLIPGSIGATINYVVPTGGSLEISSGPAPVGEVFTDFEPQYVWLHKLQAGADYVEIDSLRGITPQATQVLRQNVSAAESTAVYASLTATGFKFEGTEGSVLNEQYVWMAICRSNKPPVYGNGVLDIVARMGDGLAGTLPLGVTPDLLISVSRSPATVTYPSWFDRLRGFDRVLDSSSASAEQTVANALGGLDISKGIRLGADINGPTNKNNKLYVHYAFKRASKVFDAFRHDGTGLLTTENHNLAVVPELWVTKDLTGAGQWAWGSTNMTAAQKLSMPTHVGKQFDAAIWNSVFPTNKQMVFAPTSLANIDGHKYLTYLMATLPGVSKVFSYTGTDGNQTIDCGFGNGARFVLIIRTDIAADYLLWDTARGIISGNDPHIALNKVQLEVTNDDSIGIHPTGFVAKQIAATNINALGGTYIGFAVA